MKGGRICLLTGCKEEEPTTAYKVETVYSIEKLKNNN
jgi:hypothetical protein